MSLQSGDLDARLVRKGVVRPGRPVGQWLLWSLIVLLVALAGSFVLWDPLDVDERAHIHRITRHAAEGVRADLDAELRSVLDAQAQLARSWAAGVGLTREQWEGEARLYLEHHPGCLLVEWRDGESGTHWQLNRAALSRQEAEALASQTRTPEGWPPRPGLALVLGPVFRLPDGRAAARTLVSTDRRSIRLGQLSAVWDLEPALAKMLSDHHELGYSVAVQEGEHVLYQSPAARAQQEPDWVEEAALRLAGVEWRLRVWPNAALLADMRSPLPELALVLGALLGALLAAAAGLVRAVQHRSLALARAKDEVECQVADRTAELRQVNQRLRAEVQERVEAEEALRQLSSRLLKLQDEERRHIARELHDSTTQILAAVGVGIERAGGLLRRDRNQEAHAVLQENTELVERVTREIRTLSFLLHPPVLDDLGLEYALPWYVEGFSRRSGIAVSLDLPECLGRLPGEVELTLYRTVQEGLANVHHHSGSRTASISLFRDRGSLTLEITDMGRGLAADSGADGAPLGVGIAGMRERARQQGGSLEIRSSGSGTTVRMVLPLTSDEPASSAA